jgi:hypothetical protein
MIEINDVIDNQQEENMFYNKRALKHRHCGILKMA